MRVLQLAAAAAVLLTCATSAEAARRQAAPASIVTHFCGDRPCPIYKTAAEVQFRGVRVEKRGARPTIRAHGPNRSRIATHGVKRQGRHVDTREARSGDAVRPWRGLPTFLAAFRGPIGVVCAITSAPIAAGVNVLDSFRAHVASIFAPVRPGYVEVRAASGARAVLAEDVAPRFVGLIRDLEAIGYPVRELGGFAYRRIAGTRTLSKHARGRALDVNQDGRDVVSIPMDRAEVSRLARANGLCSGGDWFSDRRGPDLGHFEVCGPNGGGVARRRHVAAKRRAAPAPTRYAGASGAAVPW